MKDNIVIYGAGKYAKVLYKRYELLDKTDEIAYFVVSERKGNENSIAGKKVFSIDEKETELKNKHIIVAVSPTKSQEILEYLNKKGIKSITLMSKRDYIYDRLDCIEMCKNLQIIDRQVIFFCFYGKGYMCNCKYLADFLLKKHAYKIVWVLKEDLTSEAAGIPDGVETVKLFSLEYYKAFYTSRFVITNNTNLPDVVKREGQYLINTWHGIGPFKKVGLDAGINKGNHEFVKNYVREHNKCDLKIAASDDCIHMYRVSMGYEGEILKCGYPRNDIFWRDVDRKEIRHRLGIKDDQLAVLYAPTYRDDEKDIRRAFDYYDIDITKMLESFERRFGNVAVLLYRFHQHLQDYEECKYFYPNGINVTDYPDTQELLLAADVLLTDYSSIMWDFSLQRKPVFLYQNDVGDYVDDRGFYSDPLSWPYPIASVSIIK